MAADFPTRQHEADFPRAASARRSPWWLPPAVVVGLLLVYALLEHFLSIGSLFGGWSVPKVFPEEGKPVVLVMELGELPEWRPASWAELFGKARQVTLRQALVALQVAQDDPQVRGLYLRLRASSLGWAKREELAEAVREFRSRGKFVYAFLEVGADGDYYLALEADSIFVPQGGLLELNGFAAEGLFFADLFQKLGITYHVEQFEEYKSAGEPFARRSFSPAARQNLHELLQQRYRALVARIEQRRRIPEAVLRQRVFPAGLQIPDSLKSWGLIDAVVHETEVQSFIARRLGIKDTLRVSEHLLQLSRYLNSKAVKRWQSRAAESPAIAIVYGVGGIVPGRQSEDFWSEPQIASEDFIETLRKAEQDEKVGAIIVRLDSPGGSILASDAIWTELRRIAQRKPVYASMSDVAASGGYYLAMACDTIVAHPATLTGSIGVILALPNVAGTLQKLGIGVDTVLSNPEAYFASPLLPYNQRQKERFHQIGADYYQLFLRKVAARRGMELEAVRERARGRVWTGADAYRMGLVDTLGGLGTAIALAKRRLGIPPEKPVAVREYPRRKEPWEVLVDLLTEEAVDEPQGVFSAALEALPRQLRGAVGYGIWLGMLARREPVLAALPPWWTLVLE